MIQGDMSPILSTHRSLIAKGESRVQANDEQAFTRFVKETEPRPQRRYRSTGATRAILHAALAHSARGEGETCVPLSCEARGRWFAADAAKRWGRANFVGTCELLRNSSSVGRWGKAYRPKAHCSQPIAQSPKLKGPVLTGPRRGGPPPLPLRAAVPMPPRGRSAPCRSPEPRASSRQTSTMPQLHRSPARRWRSRRQSRPKLVVVPGVPA